MFACNVSQSDSVRSDLSNGSASQLFYLFTDHPGALFAQSLLDHMDAEQRQHNYFPLAVVKPPAAGRPDGRTAGQPASPAIVGLIAASYLHRVCGLYRTEPHDPVLAFLQTRLMPFIIMLVCVSNIAVCRVLTRRHMRTPAHTLLLAIAVAELLTGFLPLPMYLAHGLLGNNIFWGHQPTPTSGSFPADEIVAAAVGRLNGQFKPSTVDWATGADTSDALKMPVLRINDTQKQLLYNPLLQMLKHLHFYLAHKLNNVGSTFSLGLYGAYYGWGGDSSQKSGGSLWRTKKNTTPETSNNTVPLASKWRAVERLATLSTNTENVI